MRQALSGSGALALTLGGLTAAAALLSARQRVRAPRHSWQAESSLDTASGHRAHAARGFSRSSSLLALSVLADSSVEHYRGSFANPAMFVPLVSATLSLFAGVHAGRDRRAASHKLRHGIHAFAAFAGLAGTGFHLYNVTKRVGGWSWNNLFYAAPLGAPMALLLSGGLGAMGEGLRDAPAEQRLLLGMPVGRTLSFAVSVGLLGTVAEAGLLHFRGAFQHPAMFAPLVIPPMSAALLAHAALSRPQPRPWTRGWLRLTTWLGLLGVGFHARGIARCHGGWRNWSQNLLSGPPLPAPPSFTALAIAGLAALRLREIER